MSEEEIQYALDGIQKFINFYNAINPMDKTDAWRIAEKVGEFRFFNPDGGCAIMLLDKLKQVPPEKIVSLIKESNGI